LQIKGEDEIAFPHYITLNLTKLSLPHMQNRQKYSRVKWGLKLNGVNTVAAQDFWRPKAN